MTFGLSRSIRSGTATAIAASLAAVGVGTETDGSIICPAAVSGLVGIKTTVGAVSRSGIIPISASKDTTGPMARTVADVAFVMNALAAGHDAGAARLGVEQLRRQPQIAQLGRDVLGGLGLALGLAHAPVHRREADQIASDAGGVFEVGVRHIATLPV